MQYMVAVINGSTRDLLQFPVLSRYLLRHADIQSASLKPELYVRGTDMSCSC